MKLLRKIRIRMENGSDVRRIYLLGVIPLFQYTRKDGKRLYSKIKKQEPKEKQRVFYLKVNRPHYTAYQCIQSWIDIAKAANAFCYFVCDNRKIKREIFRNVEFFNLDFEFIKSDRKNFKSTMEKLLYGRICKKWRRIGYSMMTPFLHAAKHSFMCSYNIDADDIRIASTPDKIKNALEIIENHADEKDLDCFGIDMFPSRTFGTAWSFGMVYVRTPRKCVDVLRKNIYWKENISLVKQYKTEYYVNWKYRDDNIDWVFTFLRDTEQLRVGTFYIENARIIHMPDRIMDYWGPFMLHWKNGNVEVPLIREFYNEGLWATMPIAEGLTKIDIGLTDEDMYTYMHIKNGTKDKKLWDICLESAKFRGTIDEATYVKYKRGIQ